MKNIKMITVLFLILALFLTACGQNADNTPFPSMDSSSLSQSDKPSANSTTVIDDDPIMDVSPNSDSEINEAEESAENESAKEQEEEEERQRAEEARLAAEEEQRTAKEEELRKAEAARIAAEEAQKKAEEAQKKAEEAQKKAEEELQEKAEEEEHKKADAISMLNYLRVVSQEINSAPNNRIFLEEVYSSLTNNTYPNVVDERTETYIEDLLNALERCRMLSVKRDRIQFIYDQNRASVLSEAIPDPTVLFEFVKAVNSQDYLAVSVSVIYTAANAYAAYGNYYGGKELQYLNEGWELDDKEAETVHDIRKKTFTYMLDMVRDNALPGEYALTENSVTDFVNWKNNKNVARRIQFLKSNQEVYKALGEYWLVLAQSYYENKDYVKCLDAVSHYEELGARIFRKDYEYAKVLPLAIISMYETGTGTEYISFANKYLPIIISNSDVNDWALNYFVAETYIDLYARTHNKSYLQSAYNRQKDVVNYLIDEQKILNDEFKHDIHDIQEQPVNDGATKEQIKREKKEIQAYNKMRKEQRKTELPPISEPLYISCKLLSAIGNELGIPSSEKDVLDRMMHENGEPLFLNHFVENEINIKRTTTIKAASITAEYSGANVLLPAVYVSKNSTVKAKVIRAGDEYSFNDWILLEVDRKDKTLEEYVARYTSKSAKKFNFADGDVIEISIYCNEKDKEPAATIRYEAVSTKKLFVFNDISFERI